MYYSFQQHETRKYLRKNKNTSATEIVSVTNKNSLSVEKHMELLNLNDEYYEYLEYIGTVEI